MRAQTAVWLVLLAASAELGCRQKAPQKPVPVSTVTIGQCADPSGGGKVSANPRLTRADRDLNGDGEVEQVVADRELCTEAGNCYWNLFTYHQASGCNVYVGTIAGAVIDKLVATGDGGFHDLRAWWRLDGDRRALLQEYRFHHGGYVIAEALVCSQEDDDKLICAEE